MCSQEVVFNVSHATGLEVRAKFNNYSAHEDYGPHTSASCWSPVINIVRDPRWGRNQVHEKSTISGSLVCT
jgi:beta-glucosidase